MHDVRLTVLHDFLQQDSHMQSVSPKFINYYLQLQSWKRYSQSYLSHLTCSLIREAILFSDHLKIEIAKKVYHHFHFFAQPVHSNSHRGIQLPKAYCWKLQNVGWFNFFHREVLLVVEAAAIYRFLASR